jgi:UDP:flavonoid glycosyltransferase YjiC (YdhE family)
MLIMPYSHDQPDNARRMRRLKVSRTIQKADYKPARVARKLRDLLDEPKYAIRAQIVAQQIGAEDGVKSACDALEALYARSNRNPSPL